jgi:hypothetical protein
MQLGLGSLVILGLGWFDWNREEQQLSRPQDLTLVMIMTNSNYTVSLRELIRGFSRFGLSRHIVREGNYIQIEMMVVSSSHKGFNVNRLSPNAGPLNGLKNGNRQRRLNVLRTQGRSTHHWTRRSMQSAALSKKCRFDIQNLEEPTFNW